MKLYLAESRFKTDILYLGTETSLLVKKTHCRAGLEVDLTRLSFVVAGKKPQNHGWPCLESTALKMFAEKESCLLWLT